MSRGTFTKLGIAGDWHCDTEWAIKSLNMFAELGIKRIVQLGDFGIWPGHSGARFILKVQKTLAKHDQILYVVPGNHEDYDRINKTPLAEDGFQHYRPNVKIVPRGYRTTIDGVRIVALGGANSIDRFEWHRVPGESWWEQEQITLQDVYNTIQPGEADVMFAHDSPYGVNIPLNHRDGSLWGYKALEYANESRQMMRSAVDAVKPKLFMHGHYHVFHDQTVMLNYGVNEYSTRVVGLDMNGKPKSNAILHLDTLKVDVL